MVPGNLEVSIGGHKPNFRDRYVCWAIPKLVVSGHGKESEGRNIIRSLY